MIFSRKRKTVPREISGSFDGCEIKRIQFNHSGGFKVTALQLQNGQELVWWVPNDPGNRHCQFVREWICKGGFPEDPDPVREPRFLWIPNRSWAVIGQALLI